MRPLSEHTCPLLLESPADAAPTACGVYIVLATYNGATYLDAQLASLRQQTFRDWQLLIRDDGSRDDTLAKVQAQAAIDPRIQLVRDDFGNQGAIGNFACLMQHARQVGAQYVFFADQDDVWLPHKLATQLAALLQLEARYGATTPLLVHSDLAVVDANLVPQAPSFTTVAGLFPAAADMGVLLCQNQVTGCATLINRALLELACPLPAAVRMHDWWLALLAASCGKVGYLPQALVQYRQHGRNAVGAQSPHQRLRQLFARRTWLRYLDIVRQNLAQAAALAERVQSQPLVDEVRRQIAAYANLAQQPHLTRGSVLRRHRISPHLATARWTIYLLLTLL